MSLFRRRRLPIRSETCQTFYFSPSQIPQAAGPQDPPGHAHTSLILTPTSPPPGRRAQSTPSHPPCLLFLPSYPLVAAIAVLTTILPLLLPLYEKIDVLDQASDRTFKSLSRQCKARSQAGYGPRDHANRTNPSSFVGFEEQRLCWPDRNVGVFSGFPTTTWSSRVSSRGKDPAVKGIWKPLARHRPYFSWDDLDVLVIRNYTQL